MRRSTWLCTRAYCDSSPPGSSRKSRRQCKRNTVTNELLGFTDAPASPPKERGSYRILNAQKRDYANLAGAEPRKRRKRQILLPSEKRADEPSLGCTPSEGTIEASCQCSNQEVGHSCPLNKFVCALSLRFTFLYLALD
mgnify:CR=1 FL=1